MLSQTRISGIFALSLFLVPLVACESKPSPEEAVGVVTEERTAQQSMSKAGVAPVTEVGLLVAPATSLARSDNDEGVQHGQQGHWDAAEKAFRKALETDDNLAEAQFNLGITLDKLGKHDDAVKALKKAAALAPTNRLITESEIVKKHKSS